MNSDPNHDDCRIALQKVRDDYVASFEDLQRQRSIDAWIGFQVRMKLESVRWKTLRREQVVEWVTNATPLEGVTQGDGDE